MKRLFPLFSALAAVPFVALLLVSLGYTLGEASLLAVMFLGIMANVVLRLIPNIGGFSWYMEFSQYANVWALLIGAVIHLLVTVTEKGKEEETV